MSAASQLSEVEAVAATALPYAERLAAGLHPLQLCSLLLALLYTAGVTELTGHIERALYQRGLSVASACSPVLAEQLQHVDAEREGGAQLHGTLTALLALLQAPASSEEEENGAGQGSGAVESEER